MWLSMQTSWTVRGWKNFHSRVIITTRQCGWYCYRWWSFVPLSVCQHDNFWTVSDIITKFSGHHPVVEKADKFETGYIGVRGWWFNVSAVLVDSRWSCDKNLTAYFFDSRCIGLHWWLYCAVYACLCVCAVTMTWSIRTCSIPCGSFQSRSCRSVTVTSFRTLTAAAPSQSAPALWCVPVHGLLDTTAIVSRRPWPVSHNDFIISQPVNSVSWRAMFCHNGYTQIIRRSHS